MAAGDEATVLVEVADVVAVVVVLLGGVLPVTIAVVVIF